MRSNKFTKHKVIKHSLIAVSILIGCTSVNAADEQTIDACGHASHDSEALRAQAATRVYWQDNLAANPESWIRFKILGFNDFHGALEQRSLFGRPVGGAAVLASYLNVESNESENGAFIVHAGDHVGASPPISALLQDEPSIEFLNLLTNKYCDYADSDKFHEKCNLVGTLGNHEFDEGVNEMLRLVNGGTHENGPFLDEDYSGATFR